MLPDPYVNGIAALDAIVPCIGCLLDCFVVPNRSVVPIRFVEPNNSIALNHFILLNNNVMPNHSIIPSQPRTIIM